MHALTILLARVHGLVDALSRLNMSGHWQARADWTVSLALPAPASSLDPGHVAMPLLLGICGDCGSSHPDGHMRMLELNARNFHSAPFTFHLCQMMREFASVRSV